MFRFASILALGLLAGCVHEYQLRIDGDVRGAERDTPRSVRSGIYERPAEARAMSDAAYGSLTSLKGAKVSVGLCFGDEHESRAIASVPVDSGTGAFHYENQGERRSPLTAYTVHVEAPGYEPVEQIFHVKDRKSYEAYLVAVLDPILPRREPPPGAPPVGR